MTDSALSRPSILIEKFDGTNWGTWSFGIRASLLFTNALGIADGTETIPAKSSPPTADELARIEDFHKCSRQGLSTVLSSCHPSIYQSLDLAKSLRENWLSLSATYGTTTGLNTWVDFNKYISTKFTTDTPLTKQIDGMSELHTQIVSSGLAISDSFHALFVIQALPTSYEVVQQTILASVTNFTNISWSDIRTRILSEELRQDANAGVSAIAAGGKKKKDTCNYCSGAGHWEKDCRLKARGLSREEAQSEARKGKGKKKEKKEKGAAPSVSAVISDNPDSSASAAPVSTTVTPNDAVCFYIACERKWMLDSGCTDHITDDSSDFSEYRSLPTPRRAYFADKTTYVSYIGIGTVTGLTRVNGQEQKITLYDVLHAPEIGGRFFSILKIDSKGFSTTFSGSKATISKNGSVFAEGRISGQHYWLSLQANAPSVSHVHVTPLDILHARLGHLSWSSLRHIDDKIESDMRRALATCEGCLLGKSTRRKFVSSTHRRTEPFALLHMDLAGPMNTRSIQGHYYHFVLVDDYTRHKWIYFLTTKSDTFSQFKNFHALVRNYHKGSLRAIRTDRGGEFLSQEFTQYLEKQGIHHNLTVPNTPQQNGVAERANRTIAEAARAMLYGAGMSHGFWEFAVGTAVHVQNRAPSRVTSNISPYKLLTGQKADLSYLRVFGCLAYAHITTTRTKYDPTSQKLVFVGYDNSTKGYKLWNPLSKRTVISTDVVFEETVFPLKSTPKLPLNTPTPAPLLPSETSTPSVQIDLALPESDNEDEHPLPPAPSGTPGQPSLAPPASPPPNVPKAASGLTENETDAPLNQTSSAPTPPEQLIRRSNRIQQRVVAPQPDNASPDAYHSHRAGPSTLRDAPSASAV